MQIPCMAARSSKKASEAISYRPLRLMNVQLKRNYPATFDILEGVRKLYIYILSTKYQMYTIIKKYI